MHNPFAIAAIALGLTGAVLAFRYPIRKWIRKCKRRKPGIYLVRVDHHRNRARRVNGYVGESVNMALRKLQHLGTSRFDPVTGKAKGALMHQIPSQPWSDLRPVWHYFPLPWWMGWKWILRPVETLAILLLWPRYNIKKNQWNPLKIDPGQARIDRAQRNSGTAAQVVRVWTAHLLRHVLQGAGALVVITGLVGWMVAR